MTKEVVLVIGLGEIGLPTYELLKESGRFTVYGLDIDEKKMREIGQSSANLPKKTDILHICILCSDDAKFVKTVADYVKRFAPKLVIINSTVSPGATMKVHAQAGDCLVAHSPVRGVHESREHMKWEMNRWTRYIGGVNAASAEAARKHFEALGLKTKVLKSSLETELAKLFETTYRAWMIACFQEMHRISRHFGADFVDVVDFIEDTHRVRHDRPVMFPGVIGGHCLIPNAKLLLKDFDSAFIRLLLESNEERKEEAKNPDIMREIERLKKQEETASV
jgi:UDP-N-acetyl-D-mannosaminuronate dehydrogenase